MGYRRFILLTVYFILFAISVTAQDAISPHIMLATQSIVQAPDGLADFAVNTAVDAVDANPGDGICATHGGACSLRAAIMEANLLPYAQNIYVPSGTYTLTLAGANENNALTGDLDILKGLTIYGDGQGQTIIDGNGLDRVFHVNSTVTFEEDPYAPPVLFSALTIRGGSAPYGGGIYSERGVTRMQYTTMSDNIASSSHPCSIAGGAAVFASESFIVENSIFTGNQTPTTDVNDHIGVIATSNSETTSLDLAGTMLVDNQADWALVIADNSCTEALGFGELREVAIANNAGGGAYISSSEITIQGSTISGNEVGLWLVQEGGSSNLPVLDASHVTIAENITVGLRAAASAVLDVDYSILAYNGVQCDMTSQIDPGAYSIASDNSCPFRYGNIPAVTKTNTDPLLGPLADNGGHTLTHALLPGSPAIDFVLESHCSAGSNFEQRGIIRQDPCDAGAYELIDPEPSFAPTIERFRGTLYHSWEEAVKTDFYIQFSERMYDPVDNSEATDVTNPSNYYVLMPGTNAVFDKTACDTAVGDDVVIPILDVQYHLQLPKAFMTRYDELDTNVAQINLDTSGFVNNVLPQAHYRVLVCDEIQDNDSVTLDGDGDGLPGGDYLHEFIGTSLQADELSLTTTYSNGASTVGQTIENGTVLVEIPLFLTLKIDDAVPLNAADLLNTDNFLIVRDGDNEVFETTTCGDVQGDDVLVEITDIVPGDYASIPFLGYQYWPKPNAHSVRIYTAEALGLDDYQFIACDTIRDLEGNSIDGDDDNFFGGDFKRSFSALGAPTVSRVYTLNRTLRTRPYDASITEFEIFFEQPMSASAGDPANFRLVEAGVNGEINTITCDSLDEDDQLFSIDSAIYDTNVWYSSLTVNAGTPLPVGEYALFACSTLTDINGFPLDGDEDSIPGDPYVRFISVIEPVKIASIHIMQDDVVTPLNESDTVSFPFGTIDVTYTLPIFDEGTYTFFDAGPNGIIETTICGESGTTDDRLLHIDTTLSEDDRTASISIENNPLQGPVRLLICDIVDDNGLGLDVDNDDKGDDTFIFDFNVLRAPYVLTQASNAGTLDTLTTFDLQQITLTFNEPMADPPGDTASHDVTNVANYRLIGHGVDYELQTEPCATLAGDDFDVTVNTATYDSLNRSVTIGLNDGQEIPFGLYTVVICPTLQDATGVSLDGNQDALAGDPYLYEFVNDVRQLGPDFDVNTTEEQTIGNCGVKHCTLREAVLAANSSVDLSQINLQLEAVYELTSAYGVSQYSQALGIPTIKSPITFNGNGATIQRSYAPDTENFILIFQEGNPGVLTIDNLTLRNGHANLGAGGAIRGDGELIVLNSTFEDNESITGGAISSSNDLTVLGSYFIHNSINTRGSSPRYGGAIFASSHLYVADSTFEENFSINSGGAIGTNGLSHITLERNVFIRNASGSSGSAVFTRIGDNNLIYNNTFAGNGITSLSPDANLSPALVLYRTDYAEVSHNTFADNTTYAILAVSGADYTTLFGNIIYGEGGLCFDYDSDDETLAYASLGYNVSTSPDCLDMTEGSTDILADPQLYPLADNGGMTETFALGITSPALDLIPEVSCEIFEDQTGATRPIDGDGDGTLACDAGAYEVRTLDPSFMSDLSLNMIKPETSPPDAGLYTVRAVIRNHGQNTAENVAIVFGADNAVFARDAAGFIAETGRWEPGDIAPDTEIALDITLRVDLNMNSQNLTVFGEVVRNLTPDSDSTPDNGDVSEDDYTTFTTLVTCAVVPALVDAGDIDGFIAALYAANDETCNPGSDTINLASQATYIIESDYYQELVNGLVERTAFPVITSSIIINGNGSIFDYAPDILRTNPMRFFLTLPGSSLTLNDLTFQNGKLIQLAEGIVVKSEGDLFIHRTIFRNNGLNRAGRTTISHSNGGLLISDSLFERNHESYGSAVVRVDAARIARIERSTFYLNDPTYDILEFTDTPLDIVNSTFVENHGTVIASYGEETVTVDQSTFVDNLFAFANADVSDIHVMNSIFGSHFSICDWYSNDDIQSKGYNILAQDTTYNLPETLVLCGFDHPTDIIDVEPQFSDIGTYNGLAPVLKPLPDSLAIDAIPPELCFVLTDQRGVARPYYGACDIGSIELGANEHVPIAVAPQVADFSDETVVLQLPSVADTTGTVQIERNDYATNDGWQLIATDSLTQTTYVDANLVCNNRYQYRLLYTNGDGTFTTQPSPGVAASTLPCQHPVTHTFGLYDAGQWLFYTLDGDLRYDARFTWGPQEAGWQPLIGDWNGDGIDGIGLYRDGLWLLRSIDANGVVTDLEIRFGDAHNGIAVIGDWNGDNIDTLGLYYQGVVYLRNSNSDGVADISVPLGSITALPVVGDWNGDNIDTIALYESGNFTLMSDNTGISSQNAFNFGPLNWLPIAGDWDDDGIDTVGIYSEGLWRLRNSNNAGSVDFGFNYGDLSRSWQPLGNFNSPHDVLNLLFAATVEQPRVPLIPGPVFPIPSPTQVSREPAVNRDEEQIVEPEPSATQTPDILATDVPDNEPTLTPPEPTVEPTMTSTNVGDEITSSP